MYCQNKIVFYIDEFGIVTMQPYSTAFIRLTKTIDSKGPIQAVMVRYK